MVTSDVADVLGYNQTGEFTRLVSDDYKGREKFSTPGGPQEMVIVSELGLYEGLASSSQDMAKPFQDWLWNHLRDYRKGERPD
jgi:prophage antirepressor-like protein